MIIRIDKPGVKQTPLEWETMVNSAMVKKAQEFQGFLSAYVHKCLSKKKSACNCLIARAASELYWAETGYVGYGMDCDMIGLNCEQKKDFKFKVTNAKWKLTNQQNQCALVE